MKKNFKKIISLVLTVLMLVGTFSAIIPMTASAAATKELALNADNYINGYNYRFETNDPTGKYARIEDGKLKFFLKKGDIFYISNLTVKDNTSSYTIENMTCPVNDMYIQIANGVSKSSNMYGSGFGGYNWKGYNWKWDGNSVSNTNYIFNSADHDSQATSWGGTASAGSGKDAVWASNEPLSIKGTFDTWGDLVPTTHFYERTTSLAGVGNSDMRLRWYPHAGSCAGKSFGIIVNETNGGEISIDKITATNMNETASYVETFDLPPEVVIDLAVNADNWINGQNYRLETKSADSYMRIVDGELEIYMGNDNDLFWIPTLTIKDETTSFTFENMIAGANNEYIQVVSGVKTGVKGDDERMIGAGFGGYNWKSYRWKWHDEKILTEADYKFNDTAADDAAVAWGGTKSQGAGKDAVWALDEKLSIRVNFTKNSALVPVTHFYEGYDSLDGVGDSDMYLKWNHSTDYCTGEAFGIVGSDATTSFTIDKITATNMNEVASYVETFDDVDLSAPVAVKNAEVNLSLGGDIGFNFTFNANSAIPAGAQVVATKAGEIVDTKAVVEGDNAITVPVAAKEMTDAVNFSIMVDGDVFEGHTYTYTVAEYAAELLANDEYADWADLINAMLTYGAAAQVYFDYNTDALAAELGEVDFDFDTIAAGSYTGDINAYAPFVSLVFGSDAAVVVYLKAEEAPVVTLMGEELAVVDNGNGYYAVTIDGIAAEEIVNQFVIVINGEVSITYSALNAAAKLAETSANADAVVLANAFANYAKEAASKN